MDCAVWACVLLALGPVCVPAVAVSLWLELRHTALSALPDRLPGFDHVRNQDPGGSSEETATDRFSQAEPIQPWRGEEPALLLPAQMLWSVQTFHRGLDSADLHGPKPVRTRQHGLTNY